MLDVVVWPKVVRSMADEYVNDVFSYLVQPCEEIIKGKKCDQEDGTIDEQYSIDNQLVW